MSRAKHLRMQTIPLCTARLLAVAGMAVALLLILASCAIVVQPPDAGPPEPVIDDLGRSVVIEGIPQRIVSLSPANTEILFALGLGARVVGVTEYCDYPPEALDKETVGEFYPPDIEKIVALQPDLILATDIHRHDVIPALEERDFTVFALAPQTLDEVLQSIETLGAITGQREQASGLVGGMQSKIDQIQGLTGELENRPRVLYVTWHDPLWTVGNNTWIDDLIEIAGGVNIFAQDFESGTVVEIEAVIARNPEVIIASMWSFDWATNETLLEDTDASNNGRVHQVDDNLVQRPTPRLMSALAWFAHFIHPEIFEEPEVY